jgi:predicted NAD/FAD-dependent oxidoreductase
MSAAEGGDLDVIVIGAGIAGLCAAGELVRAGRRVLMLEKSRGIGGRMATRRLGDAVCDHGAQFFTVRGRAFGAIVTAANDDAAVQTWCHGFARDGSLGSDVAVGDGHARWRGTRGMTDLPKWLVNELMSSDLAGRCDIRTGGQVTAVAVDGSRVRVSLNTSDGRAESLTAAAAVITAPVPQALDLMQAGGMCRGASDVVPAETLRQLEAVAYDPCFALMLVLDRPSLVPEPGGMHFAVEGGGPIAWLADNQRKGISPVPALTAHATGTFSREHFDMPPDAVMELLLDAVRPWIDGDPETAVVERSLHRWKFALPTTVLPEPVVAVSQSPPIACCGDAFAGPRVEGAASSGLAAGRWLNRVLDDRAETP